MTSYNTPGHVCLDTGRIAMTVSDATLRTDIQKRAFFQFEEAWASTSRDPWIPIHSFSTANGRSYARIRYQESSRGRLIQRIDKNVIYMQLTKAERAKKNAEELRACQAFYEANLQSPTAADALAHGLSVHVKLSPAIKSVEISQTLTRLILSPAQAKAVYDAMCALNNVGGRINCTLQDTINVEELATGVIYVTATDPGKSQALWATECYLYQAAFATAYGLN